MVAEILKNASGLQNKAIRILFYVERNLHLPFLEPIYDCLAGRPDLKLAFSSPPYRVSRQGYYGQGINPDEAARISKKADFYRNPEEFEADVAVVADACYYPVRHAKRIVNVGHGMISKGWFYTEDPVVRRENHADMLCVPGQWHKDILSKNVFCPIDVTGFIKSDAFSRAGSMEMEIFKDNYGISDRHRVILFAPTFNDELSAVPCIQEKLCELADDRTIVFVKLHGMSDQRWFEMYESISYRYRNIYMIDDAEFYKAMLAAHVMISDVSSAFVEFMLLDKPVVLFNNPRRKEYRQHDPNNIEYWVRDAAIEVQTMGELKLAIRLSLAKPDELSIQRQGYSKALNRSLDGQCAHQAAESIVRLAHSDQREISDDVRFSIIIKWDRAPSSEQVRAILDEVRHKSGSADYEILCAGPRPLDMSPFMNEIDFWIDCSPQAEKTDISQFINQAEGDYIVMIKPDISLPKSWLKWLYYYFKWKPRAGAVRTLTDSDDYRSLLKQIPYADNLKSKSEIADFIKFALSGNEVVSGTFGEECPCFMIKKSAYDTLHSQAVNKGAVTINGLTSSLQSAGFSLIQAVELFVYAGHAGGSRAETGRRIESAKMLKKEKKYREAAAELENALHRMSGLDSKSTEQSRRLLEHSLELKKQKCYEKAAVSLEEAKQHLVRNSEPVESLDSRCAAQELLDNAVTCKKNRQYQKSIKLLESAKRKIA